MCERQSIDQSELSDLVQKKQQRINLLIAQVNELEEQISQKDKEIEGLSEIKKKVKKIPYNIYKEFLITTETNGTVLNLVKKQSLVQNQRITFGEQTVKVSDHGSVAYNNFLLIKIQGDKLPLYVSGNTQISTIDKLNLHKYQEDRDSYSYVAPDLQIKSSDKPRLNLTIQRKVFNYQLSQSSKLKKAELNQQHKKLLMFPPSSSMEQKKAKQQLPLKAECQILSSDFRKLKEKLIAYATMADMKKRTITDPLQSSKNNNDKKLSSKNKEDTDQIAQFIQSKINQVTPIDFDGLMESKWKQQKEQYIDYISRLEKQLKQIKGSQRYIPKETQSKSYIHSTPQSDFKSQTMFDSSPHSQIKTNQLHGAQNRQQKYTIFKSDPELANRSYFKNQYHINEMDKSRSKSRGSKIVYLRK